MKNNQKSEHRSDSPLLEVHSIFKTIQGEGPFSGTPCVFIRLAGCNLQCPNCDTDYTIHRTSLKPEVIVKIVQDWQKKGLVVITGGEPFRQNLATLLRLLVEENFYVQVETNGSIVPTDRFWATNTFARFGCYIVCSPKTIKINERIEIEACAYKYVLNHNDVNEDDGLPNAVLGFPVNSFKVARPRNDFIGLTYLQPEDSYDETENCKNLTAVIDSCLKFGHILNLQIHKIIGVE